MGESTQHRLEGVDFDDGSGPAANAGVDVNEGLEQGGGRGARSETHVVESPQEGSEGPLGS